MAISRKTLFAGLLALVPLLISQGAFAHAGHGDTQGFVLGFAHPFSGLDHVLAMVAVGIWAAQMGRQALWLLPLAFVLLMAVGGAAGMAGLGLPGIEAGIALSSVVLGVMVLAKVQMRALLAAMLVGVLALFHGYAHGAELPVAAAGLHYAGGFVAGTVLLHVGGMMLGLLHRSWAGNYALRGIGAGIAGAGAVFLVAAAG